MSNHDTRYRDLFSHVDMVRALFSGILQACVDDDILPDVKSFDWAQAQMLQTYPSGEYTLRAVGFC